MVSPPPTHYQASQPLLKPEERPPYCRIPALSEVPPDHKAVLQVRQYKAIIEREEGLRPQHPSRPTQNPHQLPHLSPDPLNVAGPSKPPIYPDPKKRLFACDLIHKAEGFIIKENHDGVGWNDGLEEWTER